MFTSTRGVARNDGRDGQAREQYEAGRSSISTLIELICQFANYTDEFVWRPRLRRGVHRSRADQPRRPSRRRVFRACAWKSRRTCVCTCVRDRVRLGALIQRAQLPRRTPRRGSYRFLSPRRLHRDPRQLRASSDFSARGREPPRNAELSRGGGAAILRDTELRERNLIPPRFPQRRGRDTG